MAEMLRDEFAIAALKGLLSNHEVSESNQEYAEWAYRLADAMLEARVYKSEGVEDGE